MGMYVMVEGDYKQCMGSSSFDSDDMTSDPDDDDDDDVMPAF